MMVCRNAAWRSWCREGTAQARDAFRSMRRAFHHLAREKKALYWHSWLQAQERASAACPQLAARNIRRQFGSSRRPLPANMRSSSPHRGAVEGAACIDAWRCHLRDVPVSASSVSAARLTWSQMSVVCVVKCLPLPVASIIFADVVRRTDVDCASTGLHRQVRHEQRPTRFGTAASVPTVRLRELVPKGLGRDGVFRRSRTMQGLWPHGLAGRLLGHG